MAAPVALEILCASVEICSPSEICIHAAISGIGHRNGEQK